MISLTPIAIAINSSGSWPTGTGFPQCEVITEDSLELREHNGCQPSRLWLVVMNIGLENNVWHRCLLKMIEPEAPGSMTQLRGDLSHFSNGVAPRQRLCREHLNLHVLRIGDQPATTRIGNPGFWHVLDRPGNEDGDRSIRHSWPKVAVLGDVQV